MDSVFHAPMLDHRRVAPNADGHLTPLTEAQRNQII
jgi:hypothetical protein